jgi:hypothetical protein
LDIGSDPRVRVNPRPNLADATLTAANP